MGSTVIEMSTDATTGDSIGLQTRQERHHHGVVLLERLHVVALGSRGEQGLDARHERGDDDRLGAVRRGREREAGRDRLGEARCLGGQHREATARESARARRVSDRGDTSLVWGGEMRASGDVRYILAPGLSFEERSFEPPAQRQRVEAGARGAIRY